MFQCTGFAATDANSPLAAYSFERREPGDHDVLIKIDYCGVCHSDLHTARNEWQNTIYPSVPGHEIVGRVERVGKEVQHFKAGDLVGVGCLVDSCLECEACREDLENYCQGPKGATLTYNGPMKPDGTNTYGGYSSHVVVREEFVLRVPESLDTKAVAPLLCAGITTYSPLRHWNVQAGDQVGVVGLGGLGHMAIKLAVAMGAEVTVFTTSPKKVDDAKRLGAHHVVISTDEKAMTALAGKFHFIIDTVPTKHDINPYIATLKRDATICLVGAIEPIEPVNNGPVVFGRRTISGSLIGGIAETQEVLDFCAEHNITADVEMINMADINTAYERMLKSDVKYRFVIDMSSLPNAA